MIRRRRVVAGTRNVVYKANRFVRPLIARLADKPEVEGIVLLGGIGKRKFLDEFSDVDLAVFLGRDVGSRVPRWLPKFDFHLADPAFGREVEVNLHQQILSRERRASAVWDESKKNAYANGVVVFDRKGNVARFLMKKLAFSEKDRRRKLIELAGQFEWYAKINPDRQIGRRFFENGHDLLNHAVEMVLNSLFVYNRQYMPHKKWRVTEAFSLEWLPPGFRENLRATMRIENHSASSVKRRVRALQKIIKPLIAKLKEERLIPEDPYGYAVKHFWNRQIAEKPGSERIISRFRKAKAKLSQADYRTLEGFINFNLIDSIPKLKAELEAQGHANNPLISRNMQARLLRAIAGVGEK